MLAPFRGKHADRETTRPSPGPTASRSSTTKKVESRQPVARLPREASASTEPRFHTIALMVNTGAARPAAPRTMENPCLLILSGHREFVR